ncbi:MAG TPA: DUF433 domain-containing protein [Pirellulales bacterium]|nr:DUF433 domain-containing protein [Pirellulales bacterium]
MNRNPVIEHTTAGELPAAPLFPRCRRLARLEFHVGWGPEEIQAEHPHLSLADVHAALAFYYDHQAQLDAQIEQDQKDAEALWAAAGESPVARRLKRIRAVDVDNDGPI